MTIEHFRMLAGYNAWANRCLYGAVAELSEADYRARRACAFFGSIHATLNHLLVVDRLWFGRLSGEVPEVTGLDQILYDDFAALRAARSAEDEQIIAYVDGLEEAVLARECRFHLLSAPGERALATDVVLATVFNHQTHHRGQVTAMLKEADVAPPPLDIVVYAAEGG